VSLPADPAARKGAPVITGVLDYFPLAIFAIAELSRIGGQFHNPDKPLFWDRDKSGDEADALGRHLMQRGTIDGDGVRHSAKVAWRALALLQKELEAVAPPSAPELSPAAIVLMQRGEVDGSDLGLKAGEAVPP